MEDSAVLTENGITIRQAIAWDVVKVGRLSLQAIEEQGQAAWFARPEPTGFKLLSTHLESIGNGLVMVAETREGRIVGMLAMSYQQYGWSDEYLFTNEWFYVLPAYRSGKYAKTAFMLMEAIEKFADSRRNPKTGKGLPIQMAIHSVLDPKLKDALFRARGYDYVGGSFRREPHGRDI